MHDLPSEVLGEAVLAVDGVRVEPAGAGVMLRLRPAQLTGLVGPAGAGKTALLDAICGLRGAAGGSVRLDGAEIGDSTPHHVAQLSIARSFDPPRIVGGLSVLDSVALGTGARAAGLGASILGIGRSGLRHARERAREVVADLGLNPEARASELGAPERRLVCVARAIAGRPRVALLDEPFSGLDDERAERLAVELSRLAGVGTAVLVASRDLTGTATLCPELVVIADGETLMQGPSQLVAVAAEVTAAFARRD